MSLEAGTLLRDALEGVIVNPTASQRWHGLLGFYEATSDAGAREAVRHCLTEHVPAEGITGFFRATFLAGVTQEMGHIADAGRILQSIRPVDPERLMAFAAFEWGRALVRVGDRGEFVAHLREARVAEAIHLAGQHFGQTTGLAVRRVDRVRKVALVASFIGQHSHTPTGLALQHAKILLELGLEVQVFSGQELLMANMPDYLGNMGRVMVAAPDMDELARLVPAGVRLTLGDPRFSLMRRWQGMLAEVAGFDPDLVLFVGLNSPVVAPLFRARPVLGLCVHSVQPMAPVDVWLTATPSMACRWATAWGPPFPPAWGHYHSYRIALKLLGGLITRADLGVAEDSLVLVTVGARLGSEISGVWAARMTELMGRCSGVVWVLVGGDGVRPAALGDVPRDRITVLPHSEDIRGLLRCCDVYVNPPRLGGGFSVAEAMAEELAVVAFADSDGGNKIGAFAVDGAERYFSRLQALIDQPLQRKENGAAMRALFSTTLDLNRSGPSLLAACEQAVALSRLRTGSGE
jgi:hypothetical protein